MDYGSILTRAWRITWKQKVLWLFGFLAGLSSGGNAGNRPEQDRGVQAGLPPEVERLMERPQSLAIIMAAVLVLLLIAAVVIVLSTVGRGGLIGGIRIADDGGAVTFAEAWDLGTRYFWSLLGIEALLFVAGLFVIGLGLGIGLLGALTAGVGFVLLPLVCLVGLAMIPLAIVAHFARFSVVIEEKPVADAFGRGWEILRNQIGPIIVLGALLLVADFVLGLVLFAPFLAAVLPALAAFVLAPQAPSLPVIVASGLAVLFFLPIVALVGSVVETWQTSTWTLAYRQFVGSASGATASPPYQPA